MEKSLLIIFVKNIKLGKVKTRLAKDIGDDGAFQVYKRLVEITEKETQDIQLKKWIYFSDTIIETKWSGDDKFVQRGRELGEKMKNAFEHAFKVGYDKVVLIGSDLPEISSEIIQNGFDELENYNTVFGPAEDGGYYLIGMNEMHPFIFDNKPWSQTNLLENTLNELKQKNTSFSLLDVMNDIDTLEDLEKSNLNKMFNFSRS